VVSFNIESWAAIAPGLELQEDWKDWLTEPYAIDEPLSTTLLKKIPPLLRRRFNMLGKTAMAAVLQLVNENEGIPSVFASRHGDTALTSSLLDDMGRDEDMSPTSFSLAVHNAISGLYSIARKDTNAITAIAAMEGLVVSALVEAIGQLQTSNRVLCVIYDVPLPERYQQYTSSPPFPYAIAMILNREGVESYSLEQGALVEAEQSALESPIFESLEFVKLLTGLCSEHATESNGMTWTIKRACAH